jgi:hypothetical protein
MINISKRLFEIAAIAPKSPIGLAVKLLAEEQARDENRRQGQRERTRRHRYRNVTVTRDSDVTVTSLYTIGSTDVSKEVSKIQPRNRGSRLSPDWKPSPEDRKFALQADFSESQIDDEATSFVDYWIAIPGSRGCKMDWPATWRNRIRDQAKRRKPNKPKSRDTAYAALDRIDAAVASTNNPTNGSISLGSPTGKIVSYHQQRNHGGNDRLNGFDIHTVSRKPIEGDLQSSDGDAFQF